jgi:thymidylate kinase
MQIRVRERFQDLQRVDEGRVPWKIVNAAQTIEQVEADIWGIVSETIDSCGDQPIRTMWQDES